MQRIGKYEVVQLIGTGGFGSVYEARDPVIKRRVAIQTCTSDNEETRRRFHREAEIASHLEHRNIVEVFDAGFEGQVPYLAQEYLPGEDLDHVIERRAPLNLQHKLDILLQILRGLAHAHAAGVLHRDLEPGNVRLLDDGRVKLMDFAIARLMKTSAKSEMTVSDAAYLAPEQLRGEPVDQRADVYSWGLVAYELLTYERPFTGTQLPDLESNILNRAAPPLTRHWRDCPPALEGLVLRCLEKDRERRFAAAAEVIAALERQLGADPEATRIVLPAASPAATPLPQRAVPTETARAEEEGALSTQEMAALEALGEAPAPAAAAPRSPDDTQPAPALGETLGSGTSPVFVEPPALPPPAPAAASPPPPPRRRRLALWLGLAAGALLLLIVITAAGGVLLWRSLSGGPRRPAAEVPVPAPPAPPPAPALPAPPRPAELSLPGSAIPSLTVALDEGLPLPVTGPVRFDLPAGPDTLRFSAPGDAPREVMAEVEEGERRVLELPALERAAAPPRRAPRRPAVAPPPPAAVPAPPPAVPPPPRPVQRGDFVEAGPGVVPPRSVKVPSPRQVSGRNLPAEVLLTVAVLVDEQGRAVELRVQDGSDAPPPFAAAALDAAQRSTFRPATKDGVPVKMWTTLRFRFRPR